MPYDSVEEVKGSVKGADDWSDEKARRFMDIFNGCVDQHDGQEKGEDFNCFAIAKDQA